MIKKPTSTTLEVNGAYLMGTINSLNEVNVRPFREKHGLTVIEPDQWYPAQQIIDFYDDIETNGGGMFDLVAIGMNIVKHIEYPPGVDTLEQAMGMAQEMHYGGWRNGEPGTLDVKFLSDNHLRLTFEDLPLPIDLIYGLCYGTVKRFAGQSRKIRVQRKDEGNKYVFDLEW